MNNRPTIYGEMMQQLDVEALPPSFADLYQNDALFREWLILHDKVLRAEKVSSWTEWTADQSAAYWSADLERFSKLRGYTEGEIADFKKAHVLGQQLSEKYGDDEFLFWITHEHKNAVATPALRQLDRELLKLSQAASAK